MSRLDHFVDSVQLSEHIGESQIRSAYPDKCREVLSMECVQSAYREISCWPDYKMTPLRDLNTLASTVGVDKIYYKDESGRFGLGSFKALGGAYAVLWLVAREYERRSGAPISLKEIRRGEHQQFANELTITTATDGNHGRSVAWGARNAGCHCRIYIHREVSEGRKAAMESFGAEVVRIDGDYDDSVRVCAEESKKHGWFVVSDTSYAGYTDVPRMVMAGYTVMASEIIAQLNEAPTHLFIQAGVGGLAAALCARFWMHYGESRPHFVLVESQHAACWLRSISASRPTAVPIEQETVMAGLSCGEVSELAWQLLQHCTDHVVSLPDDSVAGAMKLFADGEISGYPIEAGECAVPGPLALIAVSRDPELQRLMALDNDSRVLVIGCEGATDPEIYQSLLNSARA